MKPLHNLNNVERGYLLACLFPDEMQGLMKAMEETYNNICLNEVEISSRWESWLIPFNSWQAIAKQVSSLIERQRQQLGRSNRLLADSLFSRYNALFTIDCLLKYAETKADNPQFQQAVKLLFT